MEHIETTETSDIFLSAFFKRVTLACVVIIVVKIMANAPKIIIKISLFLASKRGLISSPGSWVITKSHSWSFNHVPA